MCYSAKVIASWRQYQRVFGTDIDLKAFADMYEERLSPKAVKTPKAMDASMADVPGPEGDGIRAAIAEFERAEATRLERLLFSQRKRLADAERTLQTKTTRKALEDQRIATDKIEWARTKLDDLRRTELKERDRRIYPGMYAPVMVMENGRRVLKPMRYQCRPCGKPAFYDRKYPGTYNARRDNLEGFWGGTFGVHHGIMVADTFYENVEGKDGQNQVLAFTPRTGEPMLIACLWSHCGPDGKGTGPAVVRCHHRRSGIRSRCGRLRPHDHQHQARARRCLAQPRARQPCCALRDLRRQAAPLL